MTSDLVNSHVASQTESFSDAYAVRMGLSWLHFGAGTSGPHAAARQSGKELVFILYIITGFEPEYIKDKKKKLSIPFSNFGFRYLVGGKGTITYKR